MHAAAWRVPADSAIRKLAMYWVKKLAEDIAAADLDYIVSGCPSCRDGIELQSTLSNTAIKTDDIFGALLRTIGDDI